MSAAKPGEVLTQVAGPPEQTISALAVPEGFVEGSFEITFEPFGLGPQGREGPMLVIAIDEATPDAQASELSDFSGRNALVSIDGESSEVVKTGGRYTATLVVRTTEVGRGDLFLLGAKPVSE